MKITVFTSNQLRHNNYINMLINRGHEVSAVIEANTLLTGKIKDHFPSSDIFENYFQKVINSERKIFANEKSIRKPSKILALKCGDLSYLNKDDLKEFLNADRYLTFGCSYIKGWLVDFLIKKNV